MPEKKMNWGTLILGIIIGAIVVGVVWMASKPAATEGQLRENPGAMVQACMERAGMPPGVEFDPSVCEQNPNGNITCPRGDGSGSPIAEINGKEFASCMLFGL